MQPTIEELLRIFVSANSGQNKLLSAITRELSNRGAAYFRFAQIEQDDLFFRLLMEQTHLMVSLGVSDPKEKPLVALMLGNVNMDKAKSMPYEKLAASLNTAFTSKGVKFQLSPANATNITGCIKKVQLLRNGIHNLGLFNYVNLADEITSFSRRYVPLSIQVIQKELDYLNAIRDQESRLMIDEGALRNLLEKSLGLTGHIAIELRDQDLGRLIKMIYYKTIAARAIIRAKTEIGSLPLTKKDATDYIAEILLEDEEKSRNEL